MVADKSGGKAIVEPKRPCAVAVWIWLARSIVVFVSWEIVLVVDPHRHHHPLSFRVPSLVAKDPFVRRDFLPFQGLSVLSRTPMVRARAVCMSTST